jgi:hypothetical protein
LLHANSVRPLLARMINEAPVGQSSRVITDSIFEQLTCQLNQTYAAGASGTR